MRKNSKKFYIQFTALLFLTGVVFIALLWIGNNGHKITSVINGLFDTEIEYEETESKNYKIVEVDACDTSTTTKPNSKANISVDGMHDYYAYTDEKSRVFLVHAKDLYRKKNRPGRYCKYTFPSNINDRAKDSIGYIQNSNDDRGHLIADMFDGVSNAYNVTAQLGVLNKGEYSNIEKRLDDALRNNESVTDFYVKVNYKTITDRRPESYSVSFKINNKTYSYTLSNGS